MAARLFVPVAPVAASACRPEPITLRRLTRRSQFLAVNAGVRVPGPAFLLLVQPRGDGDGDSGGDDAGYGITATKKLGNAVVRNRAKRRLRALIREIFPEHALSGCDHVLIARNDVLSADFARLRADMAKSLRKAQARLDSRLEEKGSATQVQKPC